MAIQRFQAQLGYTFSNFNDNLTEFNALNPFNLNPDQHVRDGGGQSQRALRLAAVEFGASGQADAGL